MQNSFLHILQTRFFLQKNSPIDAYISGILAEHSELLERILSLGYEPYDARLQENLRDGNIFVRLNENEKFAKILWEIAGAEYVLQVYFSHPDAEKFAWPWSGIKLELSSNNLSGSF